MTEKQRDKAAKRTQDLLKSVFNLLRKTKTEIETDAKSIKRN